MNPDSEPKLPFQLAAEACLEVKVKNGEVMVRCSDATAEYLIHPPAPYDAPQMCTCPQRDYPHELSVHDTLRSEFWKPENRFRWPWSTLWEDAT